MQFLLGVSKATTLSMLAASTVCKLAQLCFEETLCGAKLPLVVRKGAAWVCTVAARQECFAHTRPVQIWPLPDLRRVVSKAAVASFSAPSRSKKLAHLCLLKLLGVLFTHVPVRHRELVSSPIFGLQQPK